MSYGQIDPMSGRMDNTPNYGHGDGYDGDGAPTVYECEAADCTHRAMSIDEAPYGDMEQCEDCEGRFCPAHIVTASPRSEPYCLDCTQDREISAASWRADAAAEFDTTEERHRDTERQ